MMTDPPAGRDRIEADLRHAIERQELELHFQPRVSLNNGKIVGAEALLRWMHPELGLMLPDQFIPVAEDGGLIVSIGCWVLREACQNAKRWIDAGLPFAAVAVKLSALELQHGDFLECLRVILKETGLDPRRLQLAITESALVGETESLATALRELKNMHVQLVADDFGTGSSSFSDLARLQVDALKIHQSLVNGIAAAGGHSIIVSSIVELGNRLKLQVVAEGVENEVQLSFLNELGCETGQGHFFSRPVTGERFREMLEIAKHDAGYFAHASAQSADRDLPQTHNR